MMLGGGDSGGGGSCKFSGSRGSNMLTCADWSTPVLVSIHRTQC